MIFPFPSHSLLSHISYLHNSKKINLLQLSDGDGVQYTTYSKTIYFNHYFAKTPIVAMAINSVWMKSAGNKDWWGYDLRSTDISRSGFKGHLKMMDRHFSSIWGTWIACSVWRCVALNKTLKIFSWMQFSHKCNDSFDSSPSAVLIKVYFFFMMF